MFFFSFMLTSPMFKLFSRFFPFKFGNQELCHLVNHKQNLIQ